MPRLQVNDHNWHDQQWRPHTGRTAHLFLSLLVFLNRDTETQGPADSVLIFGWTLKGKFHKLLHFLAVHLFVSLRFSWYSSNKQSCWLKLVSAICNQKNINIIFPPTGPFYIRSWIHLPFFSSSCWELSMFPTAGKIKWNLPTFHSSLYDTHRLSKPSPSAQIGHYLD